ncbi:hypothetical protein Vadar_011985 [Vaccinium darrowii]|uniref:Uncharacterized protein n=1 Tax=Vaccinium darrowii TaxID=229202 RepID=A0ACB7ZJ12_9ERIC|nr:hypothetical protein Vadar_011985 [Vaccinium darrowii]
MKEGNMLYIQKLETKLWWRLRWLASNSHRLNGDHQLECSGVGSTPDIPDLTRLCSTHRPLVVAVVVKDWKGKIVDGITKSVHTSSSLHGELFVMREACLLISAMGLQDDVVESYNKEAIHLSVSELVPLRDVNALVIDIRELAPVGKAVFNFVRHSTNVLAHSVAKLALRGSLPVNWVSSPPLSIMSVSSSEFAL